jgi:uncharacterized protein (TIGR00725 family)
VGILPGSHTRYGNPHGDVVIPTGLGLGRNGIAALTSARVVVGGEAGTMAEVATAWSARRLIVSMKNVPGYSGEVAD